MYNFKFPDIGEGIHEGKLLKWFYKEGDNVGEGETLCLIETDKVNAEIPSPVKGIIKKLGVAVGEIIHVGDTLVLIQDQLDVVESTPKSVVPVESTPKTVVAVDESDNAGVVGQIEVSSMVIATSTEESQSVSVSSKVLASPKARQLAKTHAIDIKTIQGSGEFGRVLQTDIEQVLSNKTKVQPTQMPVSSKDTQGIRRVPITALRKAIVNSITLSKQIIPHTTLMDEIDVTELVRIRGEQKGLALNEGIQLTYMPFIIKAITKTLQEYPIFNASFDHEKGEILYKDFMHIGFAVDTPEGLIVPNIKNANQLSILELAKQLKDLQNRAINRSIQLKDIQNGTFTITNYGAFDSTFGAPIIKYPEVAIMGIGKITQKPIVKNNEIVIAYVMPISFAVDHRIIDGADAGRFAMKFKSYLMNPVFMLLS